MRELETGSVSKSVRWGTAVPRARSTQVECALRARFRMENFRLRQGSAGLW